MITSIALVCTTAITIHITTIADKVTTIIAIELKCGVCLASKLLATMLEPMDVAEKLADAMGLKILDRWRFLAELK